MSIMNKVAWKGMWKNKTRTMATIIGVILSAAMFTAILGAALSLWDYLIRGAQYEYGDYFLAYHYPNQTQMDELKNHESVTSVAEYQALGFVYLDEFGSTDRSFVLAAADPVFLDTMSLQIVEGRYPQSSGEIILPETAARTFREEGYPCSVGQKVTLSVQTDCFAYMEQMIPPERAERSFLAEYTIVGIAQDNCCGGESALPYYSILTKADGNQGEPIWRRAYVKTDPASVVMEWENDQYGMNASRNTELLGLYGVSEYSNYNQMTAGILAVLLGVIFICSVSLIYNSFSCSVSERMKDLGLLASVGTTRKQIRALLMTEGCILCLLAVPPGLLLGNGAVMLAVQTLGKYIHVQYSYSLSGDVLLKPALPLHLSVAAAVITVLTAFVSVSIPALRASRSSPISVIRQHTQYQVSGKKRSHGFWAFRLFGFPAVLAGKYFTVNRRRYMTVIVSLVLSVVVFISAASVSGAIRTAAETIVRTQDFDFYISGTKEQLDEICSLDCVEKSALSKAVSYAVMVDDEDLSEEFINYWIPKSNIYHSSFPYYVRNIVLLYLEDAVLLEYLEENGIDSAPYFDREEPEALLCQSIFDATYTVSADYGVEKKAYPCFAFTEQLGSLDLLPYSCFMQKELKDYAGSNNGLAIDVDGTNTPFVNVGMQRFMMDVSYDEENVATIDYYACDMSQYLGNNVYSVTDTLVTSCSEKVPRLRLGELVEERPYGVGTAGVELYSKSAEHDEILLILPLSAMDTSGVERLRLSVTSSDYSELKSYLMNSGLNYEDFKGEEERQRCLVQIVDVLSYVFLILVVLICVCNVFNTVSTNITLRRPDYGMLRSIGMKDGQFRTMLMLECLNYGLRAMLLGIPLGCCASVLVHSLMKRVVVSEYALPTAAILIAVGCVLTVVVLSMVYASGKLRGDNPIEAIRMENT